MRARAMWFEGPGNIAVREEELRARPGEVLVVTRLMGISHGTELLAWRGEMPEGLEADAVLASLPGALRYPMKYGYSCVGTTESGRRVFAFFPHQDRFYVAPEELLGIPDALAFEDAAFLATMETALGIVHDAAPRYGESALVAGLGVVGLLVAEILLASGVRPVIGVERHPLRREAGRRAGCEVLDPADPARLERIRALTGGRGADLAVNVSGSPAGLQLAIDTTVFEGTVVEASWYGERRATLQLGEAFHRGRLRLRSSQVSRIDPALSGRWDKSRRFGTVLDLLAQLRPSRYLTHRFALDRAAEAFALIDQRPGECIQVALEP